jgi:general nucleoside transport system permease protein
MTFAEGVLITAVSLMVPVLLAALGELISERAGVLNIGLEGMMAAGAYIGFLVMLNTSSPWLSGGAAMLAGMAVALLMVAACVYGSANQIVVGFALFLMAPGVVDFLYAQNTELGSTPALDKLELPLLSDIPLIGEALFAQNGFFYVAVAIAVIVAFVVSRTQFGLESAAAGHDPAAAAAKGVPVKRVRAYATLAAGMLAGLGGAALTVGALGSYSAGVISGRGFIAIAIVILGRWQVKWVVLASLAIGLTDALRLRLEQEVDIPVQLLGLLPWLVVLAMLIAGARVAVMPRALGRQGET